MKKSNSSKQKSMSFKDRVMHYITPTSVFLVSLFLLAVFLRSYNLSNSLFFGPEQGIDFERIKSVAVDHRPVLVGAKTDIPGIFHGPIYYYVSAVPFLLTHGDPVYIAYFLIILNALTVFPLYLLGKGMFGKRAGFIAVILFAVSYGAITYTHWLSSHPLVIPLSTLFLMGMYSFLEGKKRYLYLASISYALLGQAEFLNYLLYGAVILAVVLLFFKKFRKQSPLFLLINIILVMIFGFFHYAIFELRNQFIMSKSLLTLSHGGGFYISYSHVFQQVYEVGTKTLALNILPFLPGIFALLILVIGVVFLLKSQYTVAKKLLFMQMVIPVLLLIILKHDILDQFFVYAIVGELLITAFLIEITLRKNKIVGLIFLIILIVIQMRIWFLYVPENKFMFFSSVQPDLHIKDERAVIDEIYTREKGKNFSFQAYTIPYWSQQGWEYLFWQYGAKKYGYTPVSKDGKTLYVIVQDDLSSKHFQDDWLKYTVSKWGDYKGTFKKGIFTVRVLDVPWLKK